jgi:hypothetical protein
MLNECVVNQIYLPISRWIVAPSLGHRAQDRRANALQLVTAIHEGCSTIIVDDFHHERLSANISSEYVVTYSLYQANMWPYLHSSYPSYQMRASKPSDKSIDNAFALKKSCLSSLRRSIMDSRIVSR